MLASNALVLVALLAFHSVYSTILTGTKINAWHWTLAIFSVIAFIVSDACFNIGTWLLAYRYYICADKLEDVHANTKTPDEKTVRRERN
jgi:hypothetical protein